MNKEIPLVMQMTPKQIDSFCNKIISRSRNTANIHEALMVLEAFTSAFSKDSHGADSYKNIQDTLKKHSQKTRKKLMSEKTTQLGVALISHDIKLLADVYASLSRNGFYQILTNATDEIDRSQITPMAEWVIAWAVDAKQKAEDASGYPDALDFEKAEIDIVQYQVMTDIAYFFNNTYS